MNPWVKRLAQQTSVGMAAAVADGREEDANLLLKAYLEDARIAEMTPMQALALLVKTSVGLAVGAKSDDHDWFRRVAVGMAGKS